MNVVATELVDRTLLSNGIVVVDPTSRHLTQAARGNKIQSFRVTEETPDTKSFGKLTGVKLTTPLLSDLIMPEVAATIPVKYRELDVKEFLTEKLLTYLGPGTVDEAGRRVHAEYSWMEQHDQLDIIRTLVFVVDRLQEHGIVWGVGRGSSVNSFILFLIGVHAVDPLKYGLDWREFLRD